MGGGGEDALSGIDLFIATKRSDDDIMHPT